MGARNFVDSGIASIKSKGFSGEYWNLHRNSLLFSSALFLLSISTAEKPKLNIFGNEFADIKSSSLIILLMVAATYAISSFFFEWREECYPTVKKDNDDNKVANEAIKESTATLTRSLSGVEKLVDAHKDFSRRVSKGEFPLPSKLISSSATKTLEDLRVRGIRDAGLDKRMPRTDEQIEAQVEANLFSARNFSMVFQENVHAETIKFQQEFHDGIKNLENTLEKIQSDVAQARREMALLPAKLNAAFSFSMARGLVFALIVPAGAYFFAMARAMWRLCAGT